MRDCDFCNGDEMLVKRLGDAVSISIPPDSKGVRISINKDMEIDVFINGESGCESLIRR